MADGFGGGLLFAIQDNANTSNLIARISAIRSGADNSGRLSFGTSTTGTDSEKMTILPNGNVGIGTASPARLLSLVTSSSDDGLQIRRSSNTTNEFASLSFLISSSESSASFGEIRGVRTNRAVSTDTDLSFHTRSNGALGERLRIRDDGLVGINETSPSAQLQVRATATNRVPLRLDIPTGSFENITEWRTNNNITTFVGFSGYVFSSNGFTSTTSGLYNQTSVNNANIIVPTTGVVISRNVADSNPALIVNLTNASSTGHIQVWQSETSAKAHITRTGIFVGQTRPTQNEQTGNYTLALADEGKVLRVNSSSNRTITIPKNSAVAFPIDTEIAILRYGTGTVSIAPVDGDVTLQSADGERKIRNRYGSVALKKIGENEWVLVGSLEA
jgi:hypothetical protein